MPNYGVPGVLFLVFKAQWALTPRYLATHLEVPELKRKLQPTSTAWQKKTEFITILAMQLIGKVKISLTRCNIDRRQKKMPLGTPEVQRKGSD